MMKPTPWEKPKTLQEQPSLQTWRISEAGWQLPADPNRLETLAESFTEVNLPEMDSVALQNRTDTKFVMTADALVNTLTGLQNDYRILSVEGRRLIHYSTVYFDTPDFGFYTSHINGQGEYFKIRSREYTDTNLSFLEVKQKTRKGRTEKYRLQTPQQVNAITGASWLWLGEFLPCSRLTLEPKVWNTFTRITLVSLEQCERVTLDTDLTFYTAQESRRLENLVIAEVKKENSHNLSPFLYRMRAFRIKASGFSKYCMGTALLYDTVKKNSLKPNLLRIQKITGESIHE